MNEKIAKKLRKQFRKFDSGIKFEADKYFQAMLQRNFKERCKIALKILKGV